MKNVYKLILLVAIFCVAPQVYSQTFGIRAGLNLSNLNFKADGESENLDMKPGFQLGPTAEFAFGEKFAFETGLLFSTKGTQSKEAGITDKLTLVYLDIPLNIKAYVPAGDIKIFGLVGPYIGVGISGKEKYEADGESESDNVVFGSGADADFKRVDFGLALGAGVGVKNVQIGLSYGIGIANLAPFEEESFSMKNSNLSFTLGFQF